MPAKILIIDDDKFTRQVLSKILMRDKLTARYDPQIFQASNGKEGVQTFEKERPALVIVDLFMPKMDGFAVCKYLRSIADPDELAIAVTSGVYKRASLSRQIQDDYGATFFAKPYQLKNLAEFAARAIAPGSSTLAGSSTEAGPTQARSGSLENRGAAMVFWDMLEQEATGCLLLRRGQIVRQIELFVGHPVSVTTNVREETLGHFLVARKVIDAHALSKAMALAASSKKRLGEALIEAGAITPNILLKELTAQTRLKLVRALRWQSGSWDFRPGPPRNSRSNALDFAEVIVSGLASTAEVSRPSPAVAALQNTDIILSDRGEAVLAQLGRSVNSTFVEHFKPGMRMDELRRRGVKLAELYSCIDVLLHCDGLRIPEDQPASAPLKTSKLEALTEISSGRKARPHELYSSLFDSDTAPLTRSGASPLSDFGAVELWSAPHSSEAKASEPPEGIARSLEGTGPIDLGTLETQGNRIDRDFDEDSVVSVSFSTIAKKQAAPQSELEMLLAEFLRVQGKSFSEILRVEADAGLNDVEEAYAAHMEQFGKSRFSATNLGRDYQKLDILLATYSHAREVLIDPERRDPHTESQEPNDWPVPNQPSLDAEIHYREAEQLLDRGEHAGAIEELNSALAISPDEAAYHALLGWARFLRGGQTSAAADEARSHISAALVIDNENKNAHEYKGLIHAQLGDDLDAAIEHLGRAVEQDPRRAVALAALESLLLGRGAFRDLEGLYRRLISQLGDGVGSEESNIWTRLGDLYASHLRDTEAALRAYEAAIRLSPSNQQLRAKHAKLKVGNRGSFFSACEERLDSWRDSPTDSAPLEALFALATESQLHDSSYLAASALVAIGHNSEEAETCYRRYRPRFLMRAQEPLDEERWEQLRHAEDHTLVGALYAMLAPMIQAIAPVQGARNELAKADLIEESALPRDFRAVRDYVSHVMGMATPAVYSRADYGRMISVAATATPVLLAGYDILTCADKPELAFRLGRAMSYLRPGRTVAAGSPARVLKSAMLACYSLGMPDAQILDPDGNLEAFQTALAQSNDTARYQLQELVAHISQEHPTLNLSQWARNLARSADRTGLLFCGDLPLSLRCLDKGGNGSPTVDLLAFNVSPAYALLRQSMGLSIEV